MPNQDAIDWDPLPGSGPPLVLAVSDGHGSAKSFRSDRGARFAVDVALRQIRGLLQSEASAGNLSQVKRLSEERLPQLLVRDWRDEVDRDISADPLSSSELTRLEQKEGVEALGAIERNPRLVYGATLLAVAVSHSFIIHLQLGDGDVLEVSQLPEVTRPLARDERLLGNDTTSLCAPDAWRDVRVSFQAISGSPPALVLLSTDGYANSFRSEEDFLKVGADLLAMLRADGLDAVQARIEPWLSETSSSGSGDDITLGLLCRMDALHGNEDSLAGEDREMTKQEGVNGTEG